MAEKFENSSAAKNTFDNISKEETSMTNTASVLNPVENTIPEISEAETPKRVTYSETAVRIIRQDILNGWSFEKIKQKRGVKQMSTIKVWLDRFYSKKKKLANDLYKLLIQNNANAKKVPFAVQVEPEVPVEVQDSPGAPDINDFYDWFEGDPLVDVLIDSDLTPEFKERAVAFCKSNNLTFGFSNPDNYINLEAIFLGKPLVISDSFDRKLYCDMDAVKFMWHYALPELQATIEEKEQEEIEFAKSYTFKSMTVGKNGVYSCFKTDLAKEFHKGHSLHEEDQLFILVDSNLATERFGIRENSELCFVVIESNKMVTSWKYVLRNGVFYEIGYATGPKSALLKFIKRA
jgi:hypothetical protein